jgi:hypothetical protein
MLKRSVPFALLTLVQLPCMHAQNTPPPTPAVSLHSAIDAKSSVNSAWTAEQMATMVSLRNRAMGDSYAITRLRHLTDNIGPRLSGSAQAAMAVDYVAGEMRSLGASVTLEKTMVQHWVRGLETGELVTWPGQTSGTTQKIVLTALGGSVATPDQGVIADVLVVSSFEELKRLPKGAVTGKILLFNKPFDKRLAAQGNGDAAYGQAVIYRGLGPSVGAAAGATAVLVRSVGGADYRLPHTGALEYSPNDPQVPAAAVTAEDADLLANLTQQGPVRMHLTLTPKQLPPVESANVIADWKGSEHPEQIVIVSGHLDSWDLGTGAIDDGAGVVVAMETIHLMKELNLHPKRTIRFIAWMDEEHAAEGSAIYAQEHAGEFANHVGALESDFGAGHPAGIAFVGSPQLETWLRPMSVALDDIGASALIRSPYAGEDINPLTAKGVPSFAPAQDGRFYFNYHHTAADTFDKVNPNELNENAAVTAVLAYALADAAEPAPR